MELIYEIQQVHFNELLLEYITLFIKYIDISVTGMLSIWTDLDPLVAQMSFDWCSEHTSRISGQQMGRSEWPRPQHKPPPWETQTCLLY